MPTTSSELQRQTQVLHTKMRRPFLQRLLPGTLIALLVIPLIVLPYWHIVADKLDVETHHHPQALPTAPASFGQWQNSLREQLASALKINREPGASENASFRMVEDKLVTTMMFNGALLTHRRQTLEFNSHSGIPGFAYLLLPARVPDKQLPCIICLPGHGAGVDHAVGIDADGALKNMWDGTPRDFALFYACRGYAVLAMEQVGIGRRARAPLAISNLEKTECLFTDALFRYKGSTTCGERVQDVMSVLDYLQHRKEVDPARIGVMGISAGGTTALLSAALDKRLKCAIVVSAFSTYNDSTFRQLQCMCNYVPNLPRIAGSGEIAGLIAPRALFVESGLTDDRFPARSARTAFETARQLYEVSGSTNKVVLDVCNHGHRCFFGKKSVPFLEKNL